MYANGTLKTLKALVCLYAFIMLSSAVMAQSKADFNFNNHSLVSGKDKKEGARYRFTNVKTGIDAEVTIVALVNGATVQTLDDNSNGTGFREAFQPRLQVTGKSYGYGEFQFRFLKTGTNKDTVLDAIPATSIDVDGNNSGPDSLLEFDEYMLTGNTFVDFDMIATQLRFTMNGNSILGRHSAAVEYDGIDTLGKPVMFSVIYTRTSTFSVRIGVDNQKNGNATRQRSIYFNRFVYPNSILPAKSLRSFTSVARDNKVQLDFTMNAGHNIVSAHLQKSVDGRNFSNLYEVSLAAAAHGNYTDLQTGKAYYRLEMTDAKGQVSYSNILAVDNGGTVKNQFKVYPTQVTSYTMVQYTAEVAEAGLLRIADGNGRIVKSQPVQIMQGSNSMTINGLDNLPNGTYMVQLNGKNFKQIQRILVSR